MSIVVLFAAAQPARAQISPGNLHASHANLEGVENCARCHTPDRSDVLAKCLICHAMIAERRQNGAGLHGRDEYDDCRRCHVEHHGRDYDLVWWKDGMEKFDHTLTGYVLAGRHAQVKCRGCHRAENIAKPERFDGSRKDLNRTFLGLDTTCVSCHFDEHRGQVPNTCTHCHTNDGWKPAPGFDHGKTKYALLGRHQRVACDKCHVTVSEPFDPVDTSYLKFAGLKYEKCGGCHADVHKGKFKEDCKSCHNNDGWGFVERKTFDHNRTNFPLRGRHAGVACDKCHKPHRPHIGLKHDRCRDCHRDNHKGEFARRPSKGACEECHTIEGFKPSLFTLAMHDSTDYPLRDAHGAVACMSCHPTADVAPPLGKGRFAFDSFRCRNCHRNPHRGALAALTDSLGVESCELCHSTRGWLTPVFDHARTGFGLEGKHVTARCRACHAGADTTLIPPDLAFVDSMRVCTDCHDDAHRGQFLVAADREAPADTVTACERCHTPVRWVADRFDHDKQSRFPLEGGHRRVDCIGCHPKVNQDDIEFVRYKPLETTCKACHGTRYTEKELTG